MNERTRRLVLSVRGDYFQLQDSMSAKDAKQILANKYFLSPITIHHMINLLGHYRQLRGIKKHL